MEFLYGKERAPLLLERLKALRGRYGVGVEEMSEASSPWSEGTTAVITYADTIRAGNQSPLSALYQFLTRHLRSETRWVHLLPFFPWSSDDGFSVIDFREVDSEVGSWAEIRRLAQQFDLAFDVVLNHASRDSSWFRDFTAGVNPGRQYFIEMDKREQDRYKKVVRPRTSPLFTAVPTRYGERYVWTTFSDDQMDLNWKDPDLLFEFLDTLIFYISQGAKVFRLDAVAFLWKRPDSTCIHEPETHEIIKLIREFLDWVAPGTVVLTETNVPHEENISYFGKGDEAHLVYQFALPPLLLHTLYSGNAKALTQWASNLGEPPAGCSFFNFTASHDGIGMRPVENILSAKERKNIVESVKSRGGLVSEREVSPGKTVPYELNITYASALRNEGEDESTAANRFFVSQAIMTALKGVPAVYLPSLWGELNDHEGVDQSGIKRRINRKKFNLADLEKRFEEKEDPRTLIFRRYRQLLRRRRRHPAFHPDAPQIIHSLHDSVFAVERIAIGGGERILCLFSCADKELNLKLLPEDLKWATNSLELLTQKSLRFSKGTIPLKPYQVLWLLKK